MSPGRISPTSRESARQSHTPPRKCRTGRYPPRAASQVMLSVTFGRKVFHGEPALATPGALHPSGLHSLHDRLAPELPAEP